jgi:hypothetical protein
MGGACSVNGGGVRRGTCMGYRKARRKEATEIINLLQDREKWKTLMNAVMNFRVTYRAGNRLSGCRTGGLSMEIVS